jgi:hypothetical protein
MLTQGDGGRQSRNAADDDENTFDLGHRMPHFRLLEWKRPSSRPALVSMPVDVGRFRLRRLGL